MSDHGTNVTEEEEDPRFAFSRLVRRLGRTFLRR